MTYAIGVGAFIIFSVVFRFILNPLRYLVLPRATPLVIGVRVFLAGMSTVMVIQHYDLSANPIYLIITLFIINYIINAKVYSANPVFNNAIEQVGLMIGAVAFLVYYFYKF